MSKIGTVTATFAILFAFGCDDGRGGGGDTDAGGGIVLMDSGPGMVGTDAGPGMTGTDAGPGTGGGCAVTGGGFPPLPAGCLPRCSAATASTIMGCMDVDCQNAALMSDTTPAISVDVGGGMTTSVDCNGCFNWMVNSCIFDSCSMQFTDCISCGAMGCIGDATCMAEETAINDCIMTNMMAIQGCLGPRANMCFGATSGFLPDFSTPEFQLPPELLQRVVSELDPSAPFPR